MQNLEKPSIEIKPIDHIAVPNNENKWTEVITPQSSLFNLKLIDVWKAKDLVFMFVKRDFVSNYKQTILGPLWFLLQPLLTSVTFLIVFGEIAKISTDGMPQILFYLSGITIWNYFADCLTKTASVFRDNAHIFGKVYFPRLTMPLSIVISNVIKFSVQFVLFLCIWCYFLFDKESLIKPNQFILLTPFLLILMALIALGLGMIISSLTTKYRDLIFLLTFGIQLLMYATPIIYPLSNIPEKYKYLILANPLSSIVETFRYAFLGTGYFSWMYLLYTTVFTIIIIFIGTVVFNKVEKSFMDTV